MEIEQIRGLAKIELHCHLDGSLSPELVQRLLKNRGEDVPLSDIRERLSAPPRCADLAEYLLRFDLPNQVLQTRDELKETARELAVRAAGERVRYLECRFAPAFSTAEGLTAGQALEAAEEGFLLAREETGIETGILVCGMRGLSEEANLSMLKEAVELLGSGVVGCDLAGDEKAYPISGYAYFFEQAKRYGMPFTIHAGEQGSVENIRGSVELGARRIGHGIAMLADKALQRLCAQKRIGVELCPTSNLQTQAISDFRWYPFRTFFEAGIPLSINTDNRTVSDTDMTSELARLSEAFLFSEEDYRRIYRDSVEVSFASDEIKHDLLSETGGIRALADDRIKPGGFGIG